MTIPYTIYEFNPREFNFVELIEKLFETDNLSTLHKIAKREYKSQFEIGKDSSTEFHKKFYDKYHSGWPDMVSLYGSFIAHLSSSFFEDFLYQSFPTFRISLPGNVAVGAFHNDAEFGHPEGEINYIIPLTYSYESSSVWVESEPNKGDFQSIPMAIGDLIKFDGNKLTHGNRTNITGRSRVSMDFRILPMSMYDENNNSVSITRNTKFIEGEYYKKFSKKV